MTIIRSPRIARDFTVISNSVCLDARLSMRSLGLLVRLLCRPDDWQTNSQTLAREFGCGREQMQGVLRELAENGYMRLVKSRNDDGTIRSHWAVYDIPMHERPQGEDPGAGQPALGKPYAGEPVAFTRTDLTRTDTESTPRKRSARQASPASAVLGIQDLKREGIDEQQAADWLKVRKAKRLPLTASAWDGIKHEIGKACISIPDAIRECNKRGWGSFMSDWYAKDGAGKNGDDELRALFERAE